MAMRVSHVSFTSVRISSALGMLSEALEQGKARQDQSRLRGMCGYVTQRCCHRLTPHPEALAGQFAKKLRLHVKILSAPRAAGISGMVPFPRNAQLQCSSWLSLESFCCLIAQLLRGAQRAPNPAKVTASRGIQGLRHDEIPGSGLPGLHQGELSWKGWMGCATSPH